MKWILIGGKMAKDSKLRSVNTHFWDDQYVINLDPIEKLLFLYFLTNPLTTLAGIYEVNLRRIAFDTGIDRDMVLKILERFEKDKKIIYKEGYIILLNYIKNQKYNSSMIQSASNFVKSLPQNILEILSNLKEHPIYTLYTSCAQVEVEVEDEVEDEDIKYTVSDLQTLWRNVFLGNAGITEETFVSDLIKKFGKKQTRKILMDFRENGFNKISTMRKGLDWNTGKIKPKETQETGITIKKVD